MAKGCVMIVDDEASILQSLEGILADEGFQVVKASEGEVALRLIREQQLDLVLLDIWMPGMDGIQMLQQLRALRPSLRVIVMSGHGNIETAVKATKLGAFDYLEKPLSLDNVLSSVNAAFDHLWSVRERHWMEVEQVAVEPLIGVSRAIQDLRTQLEASGQLQTPLLILGEPGSGKKFVAHLIHERQLHQRPFVKLHCAALSESELEQAVEGGESFHTLLQRTAEIDLADHFGQGTLYLDGLERLSIPALHAFARLMRRELLHSQPGVATSGPRVIAAAHPSMWQEMHTGTLPTALWDVFAASTLSTTPLRKRAEDIPLLAQHFLERAARKYGGTPKVLHPDALRTLLDYQWPGNVEELKATLERIALATPTPVIGVEHLPHQLTHTEQGCDGHGQADAFSSLKEARRAWEREYLVGQLRKHNWDAAQAAQALQVKERNLQRRLSALGIRRAEIAAPPTFPQRTLKRSVVIYGQGLQSGVKTGMILSPLPVDAGVVFGDIATGETVPAKAAYVESTVYATTLRRGLVTARTVEHIMAVLHMYRITNVLVKIGGEVPFMDGSARDFCQLLEEAGVEDQTAPAAVLAIEGRHVWGLAEPSHKHFIVEPAPRLTITYHLHYPPPIGQQAYTFTYESPQQFKRTIAPARTFGFVKEMEQLQALGMANGGRLTNVILVDEARIINTELRFPDEFVRHKVLDLLGDLYLTGKFVQGKITAHMTGHTENLALVNLLHTLSGEVSREP